MVVGAMLLSGSTAGLGIPKSPSFHSSLELAAAAKEFNLQMSNNNKSTIMPTSHEQGGNKVFFCLFNCYNLFLI